MRVEWLPEARRSLVAQIGWIADRDPWAAIAVGDAVEAAIDRLADFPAMARPGRVPGTRELVVVGTPYLVVYRVGSDHLTVLRVLHGAQRWPPPT